MSGDRSPVVVGAATVEQWPEGPGDGRDCGDLLTAAAVSAVADAGGRGLGATVDLVLVTQGLSMLPDGARRVAAAVGAPAARAIAYRAGIPQQTLLSRAIDAVRRGEARSVVVAGAETRRRDDLARRAGLEPPEAPPAAAPDEVVVPEGEIVARPEIDAGAVLPVRQYAMIDNARRAAQGWSLEAHRDDVATLWAGFNEVARANPKAAFPAPMTAAEIREPSATNRPLAFPYNKWHNSQWSVDQAAAVVITAAGVADQAGSDPARRIVPLVAVESSFSLSLSRRAALHRWPAMGVLGAAAEARLGRSLATVEHVELYSCFPAAVRVQQQELGLAADASATITGGMTFAGGPFNNFVFQATAAMIERLRAEPGTLGLVTSVSGLLTKPGLAVWGTTSLADGVLVADLAAEAEAATAVASLDEQPTGTGRIATYTVADDRIVAIVDLDSGERAVAALDDADAAAGATDEDAIGRRVSVEGLGFSW